MMRVGAALTCAFFIGGSCEKPGPGAYLLGAVMVLFLVGLLYLGAASEEARKCDDRSTLRSTTDPENSVILFSIRSNLPTAGAR
jgi:hypothetical protein